MGKVKKELKTFLVICVVVLMAYAVFGEILSCSCMPKKCYWCRGKPAMGRRAPGEPIELEKSIFLIASDPGGRAGRLACNVSALYAHGDVVRA